MMSLGACAGAVRLSSPTWGRAVVLQKCNHNKRTEARWWMV